MLSYLSRCASVGAFVMSFTATISKPAPRSLAARNTFRPMRPKPLIATRALIRLPLKIAMETAASVSTRRPWGSGLGALSLWVTGKIGQRQMGSKVCRARDAGSPTSLVYL